MADLFLTLAFLAGIAVVPCFLAAFILWLFLVCLHPTRCLIALLLFLATWVGSYLLLWWDPAEALAWFMD